ncbi:MAG: hypothetical protein JWO28_64 [Hyphomicrobiales bacterium]|nr:hypothetical protein [Hyphomicrobiales bacterium]
MPPTSGLESRRSRLRGNYSGASGSSSQDFVYLPELLFQRSLEYAKKTDGNSSMYALAGIPILFSALRCLLIELNGLLSAPSPRTEQVLVALANGANDVQTILKHYSVPVELQERLELLLEVRHKILHPAHRPGPEKHNTPSYLFTLRTAGLLQSTGRDVDYIWISQLQSHKLFRWAFETVRSTVDLLLNSHAVASIIADGFRDSYSRFEGLERKMCDCDSSRREEA